MGFNEFMTKLFGNKSQRDLKEITPYVDKIKGRISVNPKSSRTTSFVQKLMKSNSVFRIM